MSFGASEWEIIAAPLAVGLLVLATHVPLGREVLSRGIIFIDLAVAQIAGFGIIVADTMGFEAHGLAVQLVAAGSALLGALLLHRSERRWPEVQEAVIGATFVLAATGGLLLLAGNPQGGEHLKELLTGQILWVDWSQFSQVALATALLLAAWFIRAKSRGRLRFYLVFALAVTLSVQLVGVYLVFASLIIPALATRNLVHGLPAGYLLGALAYTLGLGLSAAYDYPAGPLIVWLLAASALLVNARFLLRERA
jgi:zinc/manganese transport system permease protein